MIVELEAIKRKLNGLVWWVLLFGLILLVFFTFLIVGPHIEPKLFPVKSAFVVRTIEEQDGNLIITGTHRKERACKFIPGMIARTESGQILHIENLSLAKGSTWPITEKSEAPHVFGPWKIHHGAGQKLKLYQFFQCHPLWITTEYIGELDDSGAKNVKLR